MKPPPKTLNFRIPGAQVAPACPIVDGVSQAGRTKHGEHWVPRTLFLSVGGNLQYPVDWQTDPVNGVLQQFVNFRLEGLHYGAPYRREFSLWTGAQVRIPLTFDGIRLTIENFTPKAVPGTTTNADIHAIFTDEEVSSGEPGPWLWLATEVSGLGTKRVPPGARRMVPQQADAGFVWNAFGTDLKTANIPQAQVAGTLVDVVGATYTPSVTPFLAAWQIEV